MTGRHDFLALVPSYGAPQAGKIHRLDGPIRQVHDNVRLGHVNARRHRHERRALDTRPHCLERRKHLFPHQ